MFSRPGGLKRQILRGAAAALLLAALWGAPPAATAQCPLCRTAVQQAGDRAARTMNLAIVVLLIPPVSIFCTIFVVAYRRRGGGEGGGGGDRGPGPQRRL